MTKVYRSSPLAFYVILVPMFIISACSNANQNEAHDDKRVVNFFKMASNEFCKVAVSDEADRLVDENGNTPLHFQAIFPRACVSVGDIVEAGIDPNTENYLGNTALHNVALTDAYNVSTESQDSLLIVASDIIRLGADVNRKNNDGDTPLHLAAKSDRNKLVRLLMREGAMPHETNSLGNTPVEEAIEHQAEGSLRAMISEGLDVNTELTDGTTILQNARENMLLLDWNVGSEDQPLAN